MRVSVRAAASGARGAAALQGPELSEPPGGSGRSRERSRLNRRFEVNETKITEK